MFHLCLIMIFAASTDIITIVTADKDNVLMDT